MIIAGIIAAVVLAYLALWALCIAAADRRDH